MSRNVAADGRSVRVILSVVRGRCAVGCEVMHAREMYMLRGDAARFIRRIDRLVGMHSHRVLPEMRSKCLYTGCASGIIPQPHWIKCPR
jgi:hypothetical protein